MNTNDPNQQGQYQNEIEELPRLTPTRYENIFKLYQTDYNQYYYNLLNTIQFTEELNPSVYYTISVSQKMPWTMISFNEYETLDLWWLICLINKINNPLSFAEVGQNLKIIKREFLKFILDEIKLKL
jgi:hypothetical protein